MKKTVILLLMLTLLLIGARHSRNTIRLTIINKSDMDIAVQLMARDKECANSKEIIRGETYYLPIPEGSKENPTVKAFDIEKDSYMMQLHYLQTYDPVYGYKCSKPVPNMLIAQRNIRLVVLPCNVLPTCKQIGEPTMRKYLPFPVKGYALFFQKYWLTRLIH